MTIGRFIEKVKKETPLLGSGSAKRAGKLSKDTSPSWKKREHEKIKIRLNIRKSPSKLRSSKVITKTRNKLAKLKK